MTDKSSFESDVKFSLKWEKTANEDAIVVTGFTGMAESVVIPETIEGLPVTEIREGSGVGLYQEGAFFGAAQLREIVLPSTLKKIGSDAFLRCSQLASVVFPEGLEEIGTHAFAGCRSLTTVVLPSTLRELGEAAFSYCRALKEVAIPGSATVVPPCAFEG